MMRLLNTTTLELHEFFEPNIPPYTILSHRWESAEVTFQDLTGGKAEGMKGYSKLTGCCKQALKDGFEYTVSSLYLSRIFCSNVESLGRPSSSY